MAIYLSDFISPGSGSVSGSGGVNQISDEYSMHAMRRGKPGETVSVVIDGTPKNVDAEYALIYTKVKLNGTEDVDLTLDTGFAYNGLEDMVDGVLADGTTQRNSLYVGYEETGNDPWDTNVVHRKHDQMRFDNLQLYYLLNADGKLVARYKEVGNPSGDPV